MICRHSTCDKCVENTLYAGLCNIHYQKLFKYYHNLINQEKLILCYVSNCSSLVKFGTKYCLMHKHGNIL